MLTAFSSAQSFRGIRAIVRESTRVVANSSAREGEVILAYHPPSQPDVRSTRPNKEIGARSTPLGPRRAAHASTQPLGSSRLLRNNRKSKSYTQREQPNQSHKWQCAGRFGQALRSGYLYRLRSCYLWRDLHDFSYLNLFARRFNSLDRRRLQIFYGSCFQFDRSKENGLICYLRQLDRP